MKSFQDRGKISWRAWKAIDVEHMLAIKGRDVNSKREGDSSPGTIVLFGGWTVGAAAGGWFCTSTRAVRTTEAFDLTQSTKIRYEREPPRYLKTQSSDFDAIPSTSQP